ncbi:Plasmodium exported protein (PHIST), unknown function [Plasmodium ovale curtisi]|uniref:Plasmodium RESA N-terminal domain-containing protein n=1 Tax=Plasmodium ovale curtisi TaxID=864141 RepID=A0A1A8WHM7_PLAOA|nr:Plasmodium exported protein (PHIST), unknown function [Plasmodium ovale curtisi]
MYVRPKAHQVGLQQDDCMQGVKLQDVDLQDVDLQDVHMQDKKLQDEKLQAASSVPYINIEKRKRGRDSKNVISKLFTMTLFTNLLNNSPKDGIKLPVDARSELPLNEVHSRQYRRDKRCTKIVSHLDMLKRNNEMKKGYVDDVMLEIKSQGAEIGKECNERYEYCNVNDGSNERVNCQMEDIVQLEENKKSSNSDRLSFGISSSDFSSNLQERELNEILRYTGETVCYKDMFFVYNFVYDIAKCKYVKMEEGLKNYCTHLAKKYNITNEKAEEIWTKISSYTSSGLLKKGYYDFKCLYELFEEGQMSRDDYVNFINRKKESWDILTNEMRDRGKRMIHKEITGGGPIESDEMVETHIGKNFPLY